MKRLIVSMACLSVFGFIGTALAEPPPKSTFNHCGCVVDEVDGSATMQYVQITTSSKAIGHQNHVAGSLDTCLDAAEEPVEFVRTGADCSDTGGPPLADDAICGADQAVGVTCGEEIMGMQ
jgi:hypothetical protein